MGKVFKGVLNSATMGISGQMDKAKEEAKRQAAAQRQQADEVAKQQGLQAEAATQQQQTVIAQERAGQAARDTLATPVESPDIAVGGNDPVAVAMKRRRASFQGGGLSI